MIFQPFARPPPPFLTVHSTGVDWIFVSVICAVVIVVVAAEEVVAAVFVIFES